MKYKLKQTDDLALVQALHTICMPDDAYDLVGQLWVCHAEDGTPVAYCSARLVDPNLDVVFLSSAGVLPCANGAGLQRRMIRARVRWAREMEVDQVITYTLYHNYASTCNLLRCGFKFYTPSYKWAGKVNYFYLDIGEK